MSTRRQIAYFVLLAFWQTNWCNSCNSLEHCWVASFCIQRVHHIVEREWWGYWYILCTVMFCPFASPINILYWLYYLALILTNGSIMRMMRMFFCDSLNNLSLYFCFLFSIFCFVSYFALAYRLWINILHVDLLQCVVVECW